MRKNVVPGVGYLENLTLYWYLRVFEKLPDGMFRTKMFRLFKTREEAVLFAESVGLELVELDFRPSTEMIIWNGILVPHSTLYKKCARKMPSLQRGIEFTESDLRKWPYNIA